ncbi:MAG: D-alanine--D-alanine ligase family protein [Bacillota bacterium]|jgi:D-alanine-D-alanine ligase|nr:ATP-grasp domain-containing protein [Candidatus Fermentithermobacillaceae bacterium]
MAVVGVMYNLKGAPPEEGEPPDLGAELDSESTVAAVASALRAHGHEVQLIEGNDTAYLKLLSNRLDIVFNMCEGLRGESRESHIPSMLEMLGIPYTGSGVLTLALTLDKPLSKKVLSYHGIPTPGFRVLTSGDEIDVAGMEFPLFVKPAHEGSSIGVSSNSYCRDMNELRSETERLLTLYRQPVLVEEYLPGREFTVGILGNKNPVIFPVLEINFDAIPVDHARVYSRQFKADWSDDVYYMCPAPIPEDLEALVTETALRTYRALDCRDLARVDLRLDRDGVPNVMEVNPLPGLSPGFSDYPRIAEKGGWSYTDLINGILACALRRHKMEHLITSSLVRQIA